MKTATERQSRVALADYAEAKRFNAEKRAEKLRKTDRALRAGAPDKVVAIRAGCSATFAAARRKELGLPPPSPDWESA